MIRNRDLKSMGAARGPGTTVPGARRTFVLPRLGPVPVVWLWISLVLIAALAIGLRVAVLDSDPYPRLSWSTALLTDEGYYIHNARNVVLFGRARTDGFNNMLIMPTLHVVQVLVFKFIGVGAVQARLISVFASLLTLPLYFDALRRAFGRNIALMATLFLGLDHTSLLYSRMALMDTPASALMICCLYALTRSLPGAAYGKIEAVANEFHAQNWRLAWSCVCGTVLGVTCATRGLGVLIVPLFLIAFWTGTEGLPVSARRQLIMALATGLVVSLTVFAITVYLPHKAEIAAMNRYYVADSLMPRSPLALGRNILVGLFDYHRGTLPYLMRHSPVQCGLAISGAAWIAATRSGRWSRAYAHAAARLEPGASATIGLLGGWLVVFVLFLLCVNYAPSRYYVLFYPALAALAAYTLMEGPRVAGEIVERKLLMAVLGSFLFCLAAQAVRFRMALISVPDMAALFCGLVIAFLVGSTLSRARPAPVRQTFVGGAPPPEIWFVGLIIWIAVNGYWTGDWLLHLTYRQRAADRWLSLHLPADSTLIGDVAPGLCLNNRFKTVNVIPGLANDTAVVEQSAPPRYILILDGEKWRERWWEEHYADLTAPNHRIHAFVGLLRPTFEVSVYSVDMPTSGKRPRLYLRR